MACWIMLNIDLDWFGCFGHEEMYEQLSSKRWRKGLQQWIHSNQKWPAERPTGEQWQNEKFSGERWKADQKWQTDTKWQGEKWSEQGEKEWTAKQGEENWPSEKAGGDWAPKCHFLLQDILSLHPTSHLIKLGWTPWHHASKGRSWVKNKNSA